MLSKNCPVLIKAAGEQDGLADGQFEAIVSVFGNIDWYGDVVMPGAFEENLKAWKATGDPIPIYWSHRLDDPDMNIGAVLDAAELAPGDDRLPEALKEAGGLWVKGQLDLDDDAKKARQVYRLMKGRRVKQFSFTYDIIEAGWGQRAIDGEPDRSREVYELRKLAVHEVGPTPIGANQDTDLLAVKAAGEHASRLAAEVKAGRVLSSKNENALRDAQVSLEAAAKQIKDVLSALDTAPAADEEEQETENGKATANAPAKDEEPDGAKSEEPASCSPARVRLAAELEALELV